MTTSPTSPARPAGTRAIAVAAAVIAAAAFWVIVVPVAGIDLEVAGSALPVVAFVLASLVAALVGWGLLALLERRSAAGAARTWTIVAVVALVLSLAGPLTADAEATTKVLLVIAHLVVALAFIPLMLRTARR